MQRNNKQLLHKIFVCNRRQSISLEYVIQQGLKNFLMPKFKLVHEIFIRAHVQKPTTY